MHQLVGWVPCQNGVPNSHLKRCLLLSVSLMKACLLQIVVTKV